VLLAQAGQDPVGSRGGFGDHIAASHCLAGIVTALYAREKTGRGQLVDACLLRSGIYTVGFDVAQQLAFGAVAPLIKREDAISPTVSSYRAGDSRWVWLLGVEGDRHWPRLCEGLERPELKDDPRFANAAKRRENARELMRILDEQFARRPLAEWLERFDAVDLWWSPVNTPADVVKDAQALAVGAIVDVRRGGEVRRRASAAQCASARPT
jgi:crotonobetainyl-CoA:carnitine CoA-transferase CaiB-like acyl-CoA transferase